MVHAIVQALNSIGVGTVQVRIAIEHPDFEFADKFCNESYIEAPLYTCGEGLGVRAPLKNCTTIKLFPAFKSGSAVANRSDRYCHT